jgi:hypothetical protein
MIDFNLVSSNGKTGPIPVTRTVSSTCPSGCPFTKVCYASYGPGSWHWKKLDQGKVGISWDEFLVKVKALWRGQLWRHNEAGDLPSTHGTINRQMLRGLIKANRGKNGFTYTHHVVNKANLATLREANAGGFTINVSCESVEQVDAVRRLGLPAVLVVGSAETPEKGATTPDGHPIRLCPAETSNITCSRCGICARKDRQTVIVFRTHGPGTKRIFARLVAIRATTKSIQQRLRRATVEATIVRALVDLHAATYIKEN